MTRALWFFLSVAIGFAATDAPRLVRPAIQAKDKFGTASIQLPAFNPNWRNYGSYLQRMIEAIQVQWQRTLVEQKMTPAKGGTVTVKFRLNDVGKITRIVKVETTANEAASSACVTAITTRAPYGPWTDDMRAVLGKEQELTFSFFYQ